MTRAPKEMTAAQLAALGPCERLAIIDLALLELANGKRRAEVRHGDYFVRFHPGSVTFLKTERDRLRAECDAARGISRRRGITLTTIDRAVSPYGPFRRY
jgi:hypothetical protein